MTTKQLEQKIVGLEKRILLLETQRPIINVYPGYQIPQISQPIPMPQYPNGTFPPSTNSPILF